MKIRNKENSPCLIYHKRSQSHFQKKVDITQWIQRKRRSYLRFFLKKQLWYPANTIEILILEVNLCKMAVDLGITTNNERQGYDQQIIII
ncbi:unnamed protein product [Paramecium octaurelia]|uniref:Uncharacterized protein n=1 Tax=Paramecium octaurelia TaxID=43137 RepID=A0A8S1TN50_PAROT|nr:unnamed protein product [Paramecium octaurelia]